MQARLLKPLIGGSVTRLEFPFDSERIARSKLNLAYKALRYAKDHYFNGLSGPAAPASWINSLSAFIELDRPSVIVFGCKDPAADYRAYEYRSVLDLAVGGSCVLNVRSKDLESVKSRLKQLAAKVEGELGSRPCWTARYGDSVLQGPNPFVVTRLPDDYDPATGQPRSELTGARKAELLAVWDRMNRLLEDYEYVEVPRALDAGTGHPPRVPRDLERLLRKHRPKELDALVARVAGMWRRPEDILADLAEEQRRFEQQQDSPNA